jgi:hypothetical protein
VKATGISAAFAATIFKPKMTRAPQPDDVRQAQGGYAQAQKVASQTGPKSATFGAETLRAEQRSGGSGNGLPGSALNVKA